MELGSRGEARSGAEEEDRRLEARRLESPAGRAGKEVEGKEEVKEVEREKEIDLKG